MPPQYHLTESLAFGNDVGDVAAKVPSVTRFVSAVLAVVEWYLDKKRVTILIWPWWIPTKIDVAVHLAESAAGVSGEKALLQHHQAVAWASS